MSVIKTHPTFFIRLIGLIFLMLIFSLRFFFFFRDIPSHPNGTKLRISAKVTSEPIRYSNSQYLKLSGYKIYLPLYPRVYYGDRVTVEGTVNNDSLKNIPINCHPELATATSDVGSGSRNCHPELATATSDVGSGSRNCHPELGSESRNCHPELGSGSIVCIFERFRNTFGMTFDRRLTGIKLIQIEDKRGILYTYRQKLISFYERGLPKDHAAIIAGVVIGSKNGIGEKLWETLKNSGTAHVVVASGMNVSMISNFLLGTLILFLPRRKAVFFALVGIWLYAIISGFDAPIVRACVMGSAAFLAVGTGRMYSAIRILFITILSMLFAMPAWVSDLGFWLSAIATVSIIIFSPYFNKKFAFLPNIVKENWVTTISAQIGVVPLLYYYFGQFNILSPFINVSVLWTIVPLTIIGMIAGVIGTIIEPLGRAILYLCYPLTGWFLWIVSLF